MFMVSRVVERKKEEFMRNLRKEREMKMRKKINHDFIIMIQ
jgi:hypothetical protein